MKTSRGIVRLVACAGPLLLLSSCFLPTSTPAAIDTDFVFEVQVLDKVNRTLPVPGATVYLKSFKFSDADVAKSLFEWTLTTDKDGWAVANCGYNVHDYDEIVFKAKLQPFNFTEDATEAHVVYGNVSPNANEQHEAAYTVTLFLYR